MRELWEYYPKYDEGTECYGVFDTDTGRCYALYSTFEEANEDAEKRNNNTIL